MGESVRPAEPLFLILPADAWSVPTGGSRYDLRVADELRSRGRCVVVVPAEGSWPTGGDVARTRLEATLSALPRDGLVLIDGLIAGAAPDLVERQAARLRLIVLIHLPLADQGGLDRAIAERLDRGERRAIRAAARVVATSSWAARRVAERHGVPTTVVARPGVDPAPLAPTREAGERLVCVAAVTPHKGQDRLVAALTALVDLSWSCDLVGPLTPDPAYACVVAGQIAAAGLGQRIRLLGSRDGAALERVYAATDVLVLPSLLETYGMVLTEALARGIPVIASDSGAIATTVGHTRHGVPGLLVRAGDRQDLAAALRRWLTEPDLRDRLRLAARTRRPQLPDWAETADRLESVLDAVAGERTPLRAADHAPAGCPQHVGVSGEGKEPELAQTLAARWLRLREPADARARSRELVDRVHTRLGDPPLQVWDLASGTGSMARWLAPLLPRPQRWVLTDSSPELLSRATLPDVAYESRLADLTRIRPDDLAGAAMITASAVLDLLTAAELEALAGVVAAAAVPALITLTVTGQVRLDPAAPLDDEIRRAFNDHQRRRAGARTALGPDAAAFLRAALAARGVTVEQASSPWRLGPADRELASAWLTGWIASAVEQSPALPGDGYRAERLAQLHAGRLHVTVDHVDLLALPRDTG